MTSPLHFIGNVSPLLRSYLCHHDGSTVRMVAASAQEARDRAARHFGARGFEVIVHTA